MTEEADAAGMGVGVGYLGNGFEEVERVVTVDTADSTETSLSVLA